MLAWVVEAGEVLWNGWGGVDRARVAWFVGHERTAVLDANKCLSAVCQLPEDLQLSIVGCYSDSISKLRRFGIESLPAAPKNE